MAPRTSMLAAAGLAAGGYVATQAFVPGASGPVVSNEKINLRGASNAALRRVWQRTSPAGFGGSRRGGWAHGMTC